MPKTVKNEPATRPYRSSLREDQAKETRRRVRTAAEELFLADGYAATSMDDIAKAAGVSRQTVFSAFGSKAKLLKDVIDVRLAGDDEPLSISERPAGRAVLEATDPVEAIRLHAALVAVTMERTAPMWSIIAGVADADDEFAQLMAFYEEGRLHGIGAIVDVVAGLGALRKGRSRPKAKEAVWMLTSPATAAAALSRGWTLAELERWYVDCLTALLLDPATG
jgi:AcrR family transcriptional regulator